MGKVEALRQANSPSRSPERQRLADAIASLDQANSEIRRIEAAKVKARELAFEAESVVEQAQRALEEARDGASVRLVDQLLAGALIEDGSIDAAEAALEKASARESAALGAIKLLDAELMAARSKLPLREVAVERAIADVLQVEGLSELIGRFEKMKRQVAEASLALSELSRYLPRGYEPSSTRNYPDLDRANADAWRAAVDRLREDPDAALTA